MVVCQRGRMGLSGPAVQRPVILPTVGSGWYSLLCEASLTHCPSL
ncbi:hypothetical protein HU200_022404 [Digitaria exilis]|uniref:Uncharacterized protein n=1 Tax=Digitaria exilis TaxID=1010633 RepID=A0A835C592_9POAL|nr:hypothetical protein HU200_022404 [Digitaria exilis]